MYDPQLQAEPAQVGNVPAIWVTSIWINSFDLSKDMPRTYRDQATLAALGASVFRVNPPKRFSISMRRPRCFARADRAIHLPAADFSGTSTGRFGQLYLGPLVQFPSKAQRNVFAICRVPDRTTGFMSIGEALRPCIRRAQFGRRSTAACAMIR